MMQRRTKVAIGVGVGCGLTALIILAITVPVFLPQQAAPDTVTPSPDTVTPTVTPAPDRVPPSLVKCGDDTFVSSTPHQPVYWTEPTFTDNVNITGNSSTITQGTRLPYGRYNITAKVWDAAENEANCSYMLWVLAYNCDLKWATSTITDHTIMTCSINNPYFTCQVDCTQRSVYSLKPDNADIYQCQETGEWTPLGKCVRTQPKNGDPKCNETLKAEQKKTYLTSMNFLENTLGIRTCVPGPCYYNSTNMFQLCGDTPP
ncbi:sushi, von Willebrand factor type A, EGF and pentraxin domain-containing protein 1-like [Lineus longissimus]|uniref:sushi, von Willebrand factor type A, EGF and pentraxin domain-containing protein 1-like n=1 Tax=Lineus longissimus TaxID=88925 RepID=UPI002B4E6B0F